MLILHYFTYRPINSNERMTGREKYFLKISPYRGKKARMCVRGCARAATVIKWLFIGSVFSNRTRFRWLQRFTIRWIETRSLVSFFSRRTTNRNASAPQFRCTCVRRCGCTSYASEAQSKHACHRTDEWTNEITREQSNRSHEHDIPQDRKYMRIDVKRAQTFADFALISLMARWFLMIDQETSIESISTIICFHRFDREY